MTGFQADFHKMRLAAGTLWEHTGLLQTLSWFRGRAQRKGKEGKGQEEM